VSDWWPPGFSVRWENGERVYCLDPAADPLPDGYSARDVLKELEELTAWQERRGRNTQGEPPWS
jgi:hypothetical protein